jgi:transglutaminase-like putative cysteine protease
MARLVPRATAFVLDGTLGWDDIEDPGPAYLAATDKIQTSDPLLAKCLAEILTLEIPQEGLPDGPLAWRRLLSQQEISPGAVASAIFHECRDEIAPAGFSATTDALTTLRLGEASCGGKSRLFVALARTAGIPARMVGGIILGNSKSKRTSHVWADLRIGDRWVPFDPLNDLYARLPSNYLTLYRGDEPLLRHTRGLAFDYGFASRRELVPALWHADRVDSSRRASIPSLSRRHFSILLLAPFALVFVVLARHVVGFRSIGLFLPVISCGFHAARFSSRFS